jgi:DNA-binding NtrC family response regulator
VTTPDGAATVLLVDDEASVRRLLRRVLQDCGYQVLEAEHAEEAARISARHQGPIHLLLTDVAMPAATGPELARRVTAARPGTKVLYMSGGLNTPIDPGAAFLAKPFSLQRLERTLRALLAAA